MSKLKLLPLVALTGLAFSTGAQAGTVRDQHGNVGYDTSSECDAAVQSGSANFYKSFTTKPALRRKGEASVKVMQLKDASSEYRLGACDIGAAKSGGRDGVAHQLQGKYVPYSPEMPVNVYFDKSGQPVRMTMKQCDNNFSGIRPRAVGPAPAPVVAPAPAPVYVAPPAPRPAPAPVYVPPPAPVYVAPVMAPVAAAIGLSPYVFGTIGVMRDGLNYQSTANRISMADFDTKLAGQAGFGLQFNRTLGAELFYEGSKKNIYSADSGGTFAASDRIYGLRGTVGTDLLQNAHLFGKLGVAAVKHTFNTDSSLSKTQVRPEVGLGMTYSLTRNLALRADYDHYFKRGTNWKNIDYLGLGLQLGF